MSNASNLLADSQTFAVTAWQWLKLEWPWAVPALLFGALLLGVCVKVLRNRRHVAVVDDQDSTLPGTAQDVVEKEFMSADVLEAPAIEVGTSTPAVELEMPSAEKSESEVRRDQRIRAEIEALHQARMEQRQRIEARTVGRTESEERRLKEPGPPQQYGYSNHVAALLLPQISQASPESQNGIKSTATRATSNEERVEDFRFITSLFDDPSPEVRNVAARALYHLHSDRAATFTRALREGSPERRRRIGAALAASGLATEALANLAGQNLDQAYDAFSVLFLMAKAGEVECLIKAIEDGPGLEIRLAVVKLLALSGQTEVVSALRRLAVRSSLTPEVRAAVMEAIHQIRTQ